MKHPVIKKPRRRVLVIYAALFCAALFCAACENAAGSEDIKNSDAAILRFGIGDAVGAISGTDIALWLSPETDKTGLSPEITLSRSATVNPSSGSPCNFSASVTYTVTAEDGGTQRYTVTVRSLSSLNPPVFNSLEAMADYLLAFEGKNNQDTPVNLALSLDLESLEGGSHALNNANDWLGAVFDSLNGRYVNLDLSACTGDFSGGIGSAEEIQATTRARRDADKLLGLILPSGETSLPDYIFSYISGLRRAQLAPDMETLPTGAFLACISLEELDFSGAPLTIGERAFSGCTSLERIANSSGLRELRGYAFANCPALSAETLGALLNPGEPLVLGDYAFAGCPALTSLGGANIGSLGRGAFANCANLVSVTIPDSITAIEREVFSGCTGLVSVTIPNSVTSIGQSAFSGCAGLVSITIPNFVTAIGLDAFNGCAGLVSVTLPESLTRIEGRIFAGCISLASVTIPASVTTIENNVFNGCASLVFINVLRPSSQGISAMDLSTATQTLGSMPALTDIYVPDDASVFTYMGAVGWNAHARKVKKEGTTGDFDPRPELVDGIWMDGEITTWGEIRYYRFPVTEGLRYGVWANHNGYADGSAGDGTKNLNCDISAAYENGSSIFTYSVLSSRRYILPNFFVAASNGNVIVTVKPYTSNNTGTYAVKYGEIKPISAGVAETGTLVAGGAPQWYYFAPGQSISYTVSWEDSKDQAFGSSYTGDVSVTAFNTVRSNNIAASPGIAFGPVDSGYTVPQTLTSNNGTQADRIQLIRVEAISGGTYSIKYQE
jgi:hypothetical protein